MAGKFSIPDQELLLRRYFQALPSRELYVHIRYGFYECWLDSSGESEVAAFLVSYMPVGIQRLPSRDRQIDLSFDCPDLLTAFFTINSSDFSLETCDDEDADGVGDGAGVLPPFIFTENDLFSHLHDECVLSRYLLG